MGSRELDRLLRDVHAPRREGRQAHRSALEQELSARHARFTSRKKRYSMWKHSPWFRPVIASLAILAVGIAACNAPTEYDVEVGQKLSISYNSEAKSDDFDFQALIEPIVAFVDAWPGVDEVIVNIREVDDGPTMLTLMVWGQSLDTEVLQDALIEEFPLLADAEFSAEALSGSVEGNLGEAFGHAVFDFEVSGDTAEEIRQQILQQLAEQGFDGDAQVEVVDEDGLRTINVELTDIVENDEDAAGQTEDVLVIESKVE